MMKSTYVLAGVAMAMASLTALADGANIEVSSGTVLQNVTIVDTQTGALNRNRSVVIQQGKITQILNKPSVATSGSARSIDGTGKFLVPGYLDMHVHSVPAVFGPSTALTLLLAHGVTGVRQMNGSPELILAARQFNAARAAGTQDVPEVVAMAGPVLAGVRSAADGVAAVQATQAMGADFVKLVNASPVALPAILGEARKLGLPVAGHLSVGLSAVDSADGYTSMEHLGGGPSSLQLDCADEQAAIRGALLSGKGTIPSATLPPTYVISPYLYSANDAPFVQRMMDSYNAATCDTVAKALVSKGVWQVPTLIRLHAMLQSDNPEFSSDPNLKYVAPMLKGIWTRLGGQFAVMQPDTARTTFRNAYASFVNMLKVLHKNGGAATTLTGSDVGGIWLVSGHSLHQEFGELSKAGFTPLEILQATTINGARFLKRESTMGTVAVNKNADLVLLDANPIVDSANLSKIAGVVNAGKYFSKSDLDGMKASVAATLAATPARSEREVVDSSHKH